MFLLCQKRTENNLTSHNVRVLKDNIKSRGIPSGSEGKESDCNAGDPGSAPGVVGNPLHYSSLENPMDRGAWWAVQSMGSKELDMTEQLHFHFHKEQS